MTFITNAAGRQDTNFDFVSGEETAVYWSCSMTWKNDVYVFGGYRKERQISKLQKSRKQKNHWDGWRNVL